MNKSKIISTMGLAAGLLLAATGSAQAATHGDVISFSPPYPLSHPTRVEIQGRHAGAAATASSARGADCRFPPASLSLAPRERAVELREVALNVRTCRAVFERGVPPRWTRNDATGKPQSAGSSRAGVSSFANGAMYGGFSRAWYTDRQAKKVVTRVTTGADWNSDGSCITGTNTWFRNFAAVATGWREVSHRWSKINTNCNYVVSSVNAHFRNDTFSRCTSGPGVDTYYNKVRFVGYPDGSIKGSKSSWNEPSCYGVLIAYYALYRD